MRYQGSQEFYAAVVVFMMLAVSVNFIGINSMSEYVPPRIKNRPNGRLFD